MVNHEYLRSFPLGLAVSRPGAFWRRANWSCRLRCAASDQARHKRYQSP